MPFIDGSAYLFNEGTDETPDRWGFSGFINATQEERIRYHLDRIVDIINKEKIKKKRKKFHVIRNIV